MKDFATVTLRAVDPPGPEVSFQLADGVPTYESDGGWGFVGRPRRSAMTEYAGVEGYTLTIPAVFDGFRDDTPVDDDLETLRRIMRDRVGPRREPAVVEVSGAVPLTHLRWVVQSIAAGDELKNQSGQTLRAFRTIVLLQHLPGDVLVSARTSPAEAAQERAVTTPTTDPATGAAAVATPSVRTYTVKSGDTLSAIAARELGKASRWTEIATLNGIRDPRRLSVGQELRLPA